MTEPTEPKIPRRITATLLLLDMFVSVAMMVLLATFDSDRSAMALAVLWLVGTIGLVAWILFRRQ